MKDKRKKMVHTTHFWNNLHQVHSGRQKIRKWNNLSLWEQVQPKGLNTKTG
jgi:hypothetical protein